MIIDCMTHVWDSPDQLGLSARFGSANRPLATPAGSSQPGKPGLPASARSPLADRLLHADPLEHFESLGPVDVSLVFAFRSRLLESEVPNPLVADYVRAHPDRLIGVAGIDPTCPRAEADLEEAISRLDMKGAAISPVAQGFHPMDSRLLPLCRRLARQGLPLMVHHGPVPSRQGRLEYGRPDLLDELLREVEGLRLVICGLGRPWIEPTFALMTKHPEVLANLGGLLRSPWQTYNALVLAHECGVIDRLLFSSDFPYSTPAAAIETLYSLNRMVQGTSLPAIPRELLRGIVERDALAMLGLPMPRGPGLPGGEPRTEPPSRQAPAPSGVPSPSALSAPPPSPGPAEKFARTSKEDKAKEAEQNGPSIGPIGGKTPDAGAAAGQAVAADHPTPSDGRRDSVPPSRTPRPDTAAAGDAEADQADGPEEAAAQTAEDEAQAAASEKRTGPSATT